MPQPPLQSPAVAGAAGGAVGRHSSRRRGRRPFEKSGDHWAPKKKTGPSDAKAAGGRGTIVKTAGGVDAHASKQHLMDQAKKLNISGRSRTTKSELVDAIHNADAKSTRKARSK